MPLQLTDEELYRVKPENFTMPQAPPPALNDPNAFQVTPGETGARLLGMMPAQPPVNEGAGPLMANAPAPAQPATVSPAGRDIDPAHRAFMEKVNQTAQRYGLLVKQRRAQRKDVREYEKLHNSLEREVGVADDLENMMKNYPAMYQEGGLPNEHAVALRRQQMAHKERADRLLKELKSRAVQMSKQYNLPLDKGGGLNLGQIGGADDPADKAFDAEIGQGYMDALTTPYDAEK